MVFPGSDSAEVLVWFDRIGPLPEKQPIRVDHYLRLPDNDSLGIKLRKRRLEIKQRQQQLGVVDFHQRVSGLVEQWRKWSFPLAQTEPPLFGSDAAWIAIAKRRRLRRYRITVDRQVEGVTAEVVPAQGCELELSQIEVTGQQWWSICFEAFGQEASLQDYLRLVARHVFEATEPPLLEIKASCSYPAWLGDIV